MTRPAATLLATALLAALPAGGALAAAGRPWDLALVLRQDRLTRGFDDWESRRLELASTPRGGVGMYGALASERRFGRREHGLELGVVVPIGPAWTLQAEAGGYADAEVLPHGYADLRLQRALDGGWLLAGSLRRTRYPGAEVDRLALGVERYLGNWRFAYTLNHTRLAGDGVQGHDAAIDYYYGDRSSAGLRLTAGREDALLDGGVVTSDVRAVAVQGRHALSPAWAVQWSLGYVSQGGNYDRRGVSLGLRRSF